MKRVLSFAFVAMLTAVPALAERPNILLIVSEDNGPELGCYGDPYARTPNLDRLASEGVRFNRAYVAQAGCSQSRASVLTGLYPHQHGQIGLATWGFRMYREDTPNLPCSLKAAGYRTGIIGKLHINPESAFPFDFHEIPGANFKRKDLCDYAKHAAAFIRAGDEPFFLSVNYPEAHDPWLRQVDGLPEHPQTGAAVTALPYFGIDPPEMREMVADYYNCLSRLDSLVGDLLATLEASGKAENTIVIYFGDHGADMLRGKRTCNEGGVRIPLLLRWPGHVRPQACEELVSTVDLMPTVLAACGVAPVPGLPGRPLQPLLAGKPAAWRTHLFTEYHTHAAAANYHPLRAVRTDRYKLIENLLPDTVNPDYADTFRKLEGDAIDRGQADFEGGLPRAIAGAAPEVRAAYALMEKPPRYELYDLQADPYEFRNLAGSPDHASVFAELKQSLDAWRQETEDPLLDPGNLQRLTAEVTAVQSKAAGKELGWGYPDYFFGNEPAVKRDAPPATGKPAKKKKKKQGRTSSREEPTAATVSPAISPYPMSSVIGGFTMEPGRQSIGHGDNWAITWAGDDRQYSFHTDGRGFGLKESVSTAPVIIEGNPPDIRGRDIATTSGSIPNPNGQKSRKVSGVVMIQDVLYAWVRNLNPSGQPKGTGSTLMYSRNLGKDWSLVEWSFPNIGYPSWLNAGRNYTAAQDDYAYFIAPDGPSAYADYPDLLMGRVPVDALLDRSRYEFFHGTDQQAASIWGDYERRQPVFSDLAGCFRPDIVFNAGLNRYFLMMSSPTENWHWWANDNPTRKCHFGLFDAPSPWGPWTTVAYVEDWGMPETRFAPHIPPKWISADGTSFYLLYSCIPTGPYRFNIQRCHIEKR